MVFRRSPLLPLQKTRIQGIGRLCNNSHLKSSNCQTSKLSKQAIGSSGNTTSVTAFALELRSSSNNSLYGCAPGGLIESSLNSFAGRKKISSTNQNLGTVSVGWMMSPLCNARIEISAHNSEVGSRESFSNVGEKLGSSGGGSPSRLLNFQSLELPSEGKSIDGGLSQEAEFSGDKSSADETTSSAILNAEVRTQSSSHKVAVIGAGAAGLVAARELVREGHQVVIYEQGEEVGGVWQYDPRVESDPLGIDPHRRRVHSSVYPSLRTNLPREIMGYLDYPFLPKQGKEGRDARRFPDHTEVAKYLEDFSEDFNLRGLVKFGVRVDYVGRQQVLQEPPDTRWAVRFQKSCEEELETEVFDAVVICNGHYTEPQLPQIAGIESWPGEQIHSHNYRFPHPFQDKVVVVVGGGNSAQDITSEVATLAKEVHQCARAWTSMEPSVEGKGPQHNLWQHPMVTKASCDGTLEFQDGTSAVADIILYCTGYLFSFPFLDTKGYISVEDSRVGPLYKHVFPPALAPELSFVGLPRKVVPFPLMELQSNWIARILSGKSSLPTESEMMSDVRTLYEQLNATSVPKSYTHNCGAYQYEYVDWLAEQSGHEPVETWRKEIFSSCSRNKIANSATYRDDGENQHWVEVAMASSAKIPVPSKDLSIAS